MAIDITDEPETVRLREKWTARGVPNDLFNDLVTEANLEYNSGLLYEDYDRFAMVTVNIVDDDETPNCYYLYLLVNYGLVMFGNADVTTSRILGQVPCVSLLAQVFKIETDTSEIIAFGETSFMHTKDEDVTVTIDPIGTLTGDATEANVTSGKTFYNTNPKTKLTGTYVPEPFMELITDYDGIQKELTKILETLIDSYDLTQCEDTQINKSIVTVLTLTVT